MSSPSFQFSKVAHRIIDKWNDSRYIIAYGGSSSSKSISILQLLTIYCLTNERKRVTIGAESLPVLKKTVFPDWKDVVMKDLFHQESFNRTEMVYYFPNKSKIQFIPADDDARWHGLRQDITYFDELFYIKQSIYDQADIRTKDKMISSFNPVAPFWIQDNFEDPKTYVDHSTYKDNPFVSQPIIDALEKRIKTDVNFYNVYVKGEFGSLEGLVFKQNQDWFLTEEFPEDSGKRIYGLDFGFAVDPSSLVEVVYENGELWIREHFYTKGLTNEDICNKMDKDWEIVADSSEPKSIEEIKRKGFNIFGARKGPDSINNGIQLMKQFKINIDINSTNVIKEFRNYKWQEDKHGQTLPKPIDSNNHTIDAIRYAVDRHFSRKNVFFM